MGLAIETLKERFPRSAQALQNFHRLVDQTYMDPVDRVRLKSGLNMLVIVVAEEASEIRKTITQVREGAQLIRSIFDKKK